MRMYNKKSKTSAILAIVAALLVIGFMILMPFAMSNTEMEGVGAVFVILFAVIFSLLPLYASAIPFVITALVYAGRMLKQQSRQKLISFNKSLLIATCVLLPFLAWGAFSAKELIVQSSYGLFPVIYTVLTALAYVAALIAEIATIVTLKKMPDERALNASSANDSTTPN